MNYSFQKLHKKFEEVKSEKEYVDYCKDINDNSTIIEGIPFDKHRAEMQIATMTSKYGYDLNWLANVYRNGMIVVPVPPKKNEYQLKNNLIYINHQIPIIALKRELVSQAFQKLIALIDATALYAMVKQQNVKLAHRKYIG